MQLLKIANFRRFFFAVLCGVLGGNMHLIGTNWFVLEQTGSNTAVGAIMGTAMLFSVLAFPLAGTLVDRYPRRLVWAATNLFRVAFILLILVALLTGTFQIWQLYALGAIHGMCMAVYIPASQATAQEILAKDQLLPGNAMLEVGIQIGAFGGAGLGGVILKFGGFPLLLAVELILSILSTILILQVKTTSPLERPGESFVTQFKEGFHFLNRRRALLAFGIASVLPHATTMAFNVLSPDYTKSVLHQGALVFGLLDMSYGVGAMIAGMTAVLLVTRLGRWSMAKLYLPVSAASFLLLGASGWLSAAFLLTIVIGLANASLRILFSTALMEKIPKSVMGRCAAVWFVSGKLVEIGLCQGAGVVIDVAPIFFGFALLAATMVLAGSGFLFTQPRLDRFREREVIPQEGVNYGDIAP